MDTQVAVLAGSHTAAVGSGGDCSAGNTARGLQDSKLSAVQANKASSQQGQWYYYRPQHT